MRRGRENLFEELGRVEGEHSNKNRRAEVSRIHGELNKGYKKGGRAAFKLGSKPRDKQTPSIGRSGKDYKDWSRRNPGSKENLIERLGGSEKAKPHSTKEGRTASGKRRIRRILEKQKPKTVQPRPVPEYTPRPSRPKWSGPKIPKGEFRPLRAKHGIGSLVKKVISKIKPKPKPKPKGLGSGVKPSEMKAIIPKKDRKLYLKEKLANPLPTHLRGPNPHREAKSAKGKASGGRIGLSHGGSAGAAIRGRGAEIK